MARISKGQSEKRLRTGVIVLIVLVLGLGLPALWFGPRLYSHWEQRRLVTQGRELLRQGEFRRSQVALRRALDLNAVNLDASRAYADLAEAIGKSDAVSLRERVCVLAPQSFEDAYAWSVTALKFGDLARAEEALAIMKKTGPERAGYHATVARLARHGSRFAESQAEFATALKLEPGSEKFQYEAAVSDLEVRDPALAPAALATLERLRARPEFHLSASRILAAAYARAGRWEVGLPIAKELARTEGAGMQDRLLYLTLLKASGNPAFIPYLTDLQTAIQANPGDITLFLTWANGHEMVMLSREWIGTLPPAVVSVPPAAIAVADTYVSLKDWKRLKKLVQAPGWGASEYLRLLYLSRVLAEEEDAPGSDLQWKAAQALVATRSEKLYELARVAASWGWLARWEDLLWYIAGNTKQPDAALQSLVEKYAEARDTRNLQRALARQLANHPADLGLQNNWVMLSLLLRVDLERAVQIAHELYQAKPAEAHAAATYAFALYATNRTDDALEIMRKLPPEQLRTPSIAAYYGVLLAAIRDPEAPQYLALARTARLLPEEEQMLKKAQLALE